MADLVLSGDGFTIILPDATIVLPGHGASTTIGLERPQLASWIERGW